MTRSGKGVDPTVKIWCPPAFHTGYVPAEKIEKEIDHQFSVVIKWLRIKCGLELENMEEMTEREIAAAESRCGGLEPWEFFVEDSLGVKFVVDMSNKKREPEWKGRGVEPVITYLKQHYHGNEERLQDFRIEDNRKNNQRVLTAIGDIKEEQRSQSKTMSELLEMERRNKELDQRKKELEVQKLERELEMVGGNGGKEPKPKKDPEGYSYG